MGSITVRLLKYLFSYRFYISSFIFNVHAFTFNIYIYTNTFLLKISKIPFFSVNLITFRIYIPNGLLPKMLKNNNLHMLCIC